MKCAYSSYIVCFEVIKNGDGRIQDSGGKMEMAAQDGAG